LLEQNTSHGIKSFITFARDKAILPYLREVINRGTINQSMKKKKVLGAFEHEGPLEYCSANMPIGYLNMLITSCFF
jgi:hypothetical protein